MVKSNSPLPTIVHVLFWSIFAAGIGLHLWIADVIVGHTYDDGQHFVLLRENKDLWVPISSLTYFAQYFVKALMLGLCTCGLLWFLWQWLWHGDLGGR